MQDGGQLTISTDITMSASRTLYVEDGGAVNISGGHLYNGNTIVYSGGSFTISNNGTIELSEGDEFNTETGALINISYGSINNN